MKFVLRNANINDIEGLAVAYSNCAHNAYQGILPASILEDITLQKSVKKWRQEFVEQIPDTNKAIFVIENEAPAIAGFSIFRTAKSRPTKMPKTKVRSLILFFYSQPIAVKFWVLKTNSTRRERTLDFRIK